MRVMARKKGELTAAQRAKRERIRKLGPPPGFVRVTKKELKAELSRRIDEIESGKVKTIPLDVVMRQIREELRRRRGDH